MSELRKGVVIGPGRLGLTLIRSLASAGTDLRLVGRREGPWMQQAEALGVAPCLDWRLLRNEDWEGAWIFLAVADRGIATLAKELAESFAKSSAEPAMVMHGSGALGLEALEAFEPMDRACLHPTASLDGLHRESTLDGVPVTLLASGESAFEKGRGWIDQAQAIPIAVQAEADRRRYHLACALAANHVTGLVGWAVELLSETMNPEDARRCAIALASSALQGVEDLGAREALTGPVARGDQATLQAHLEALSQADASRYQALIDVLRHFASPREEGATS